MYFNLCFSMADLESVEYLIWCAVRDVFSHHLIGARGPPFEELCRLQSLDTFVVTCMCPRGGGGGGGGGTLIFSAYVGSGPASTVHPKKYQEFQAPPKKYLKFWQPPKIPPL